MSGLARFQQNLGVPLITHARWIDASSPYHTLYKMSGNVVTDPAYWETVAAYLANSGVATFEQDWLADKAHTDFNLTDGDAFLDNMAASMGRRHLTMQYCMASARHFLQSSKYSNLTTIRTSGDHLQRDRWTDFLYASRLGSALGAWPFTDNLLSTRNQPVVARHAVGRAGGHWRPDRIDQRRQPAAHGEARWRDCETGCAVDADGRQLLEHGAQHGHAADRLYLVRFWRAAHQLRFRIYPGNECAGEVQPVGVGHERAGICLRLLCRHGAVGWIRTDTIQKPISGDALYLVLAPVGPSGIAILGDTDQFVTMGKKRVSGLTDDGAARVTVSFAPGETSVTITGYSPVAPIVQAIEGSVGPVAYDDTTHLFRVPVMPGKTGSATIRVQNSRSERDAKRVSGGTSVGRTGVK